MTDTSLHPHGAKTRHGFAFAHAAFMVAVVSALFLLGVMMATHVKYISTDLGFRTLTLGIGPRIVLVSLVVSGLSLLISLFMAPKRCGPWAFAALVISGALWGGYAFYTKALKEFPPIADVATNWDRPLTFSDVLIKMRGPDTVVIEDLPRVPRNESMEWGGKTIAAINDATCPGARSIMHKSLDADAVANIFRADHNYTLVGTAPWRVEATYQDNFYGFKSDVVVRLDADRIDVRSVGRENIPDLGGNCRRVTDIVKKIRALP